MATANGAVRGGSIRMGAEFARFALALGFPDALGSAAATYGGVLNPFAIANGLLGKRVLCASLRAVLVRPVPPEWMFQTGRTSLAWFAYGK